MKELLHISSGKIIRFYDPLHTTEATVPLGVKLNDTIYSEYELILNIANGNFSCTFYKANNLEPPLLIDEFEVIEIEDT